MTIYTKEQIENGTLSAQDLLLSFTTGNSATAKNPLLTKNIHNGAIQGKPVSLAVLTAFCESIAVKSPEMLAAIHAGYISPRHKMQYETTKAASKPLAGHYQTAAEYLESCFAMLPELSEPDYITAITWLVDIKDSMTKAEILAIIREIILLVQVKEYTVNDLTSEQSAKYFDLVHKEQALAMATSVLSMYLDNIKPVSDTSLQGRFYPERGQGQELLTLIDQEKWSILVNTPVPAKLDGLTISEPGYNLISIQVIEVQS